MERMKRWTCRKCGTGSEYKTVRFCKEGGNHEWIDTREYLAEQERIAEIRRREARRQEEIRRREEEKRRLEAEERRQKATAEYQTFLSSAEGKEQLAKIADGYMARRKRASTLSLILGIITIIAIPFGCVAFARLLKLGEISSTPWLVFVNEKLESLPLPVFVKEKIVSLPLLVFAISFSFPVYFYRSLKRRSKAIPQVRSRETGRTVPIKEAVKFLASRDISQNFEYEDENGDSHVPEPFIPDTSNIKEEWLQKMDHARNLVRGKKWAEAADEFKKVGKECGLLTLSAPAWGLTALCYDTLNDERALACYKNAVLGYKKLVSQGDEGAQEQLAEAEQNLANFLNRNAQKGNKE
jgi:hypothetical protein